jgi:NifB/MoaA-like Fe-S oxidoreductase
MTQTQPDRLDQLESIIERIDRKLDGVVADLVDIKLSQARTNERFNAIDQRFNAMETQITDLKKSTETQIADLKKSTETQIADLKKSTETQIADLKIQVRSQDARLWGFIVTLSLAVIGFLSKLAFFSNSQP